MNELISLLLSQENIPEEGLQELALGGGDKQMGESLDESMMQSLLSKCQALTKLEMSDMFELNDHMRMFFAQQIAPILTKNSQITYLDLKEFSEGNDKGEGAVVLSALASSNSLSTITHFRCSANPSWWAEEGESIPVGNYVDNKYTVKQSNVDLLSNIVRAMKALKYFNFAFSRFRTAAVCTQALDAITDRWET